MTQNLMTYELPSDFPHSSPKGYSYIVEKHNASTLSIWLLHHRRYVYAENGEPVRTIWGFYKPKSKSYYAPINSSKIGNLVNVSDTTPYTSMPLNLTPLERAFV